MIEDWVEANIDSQIKYTGSGKEIHVCCPFCGENRYRLYINLHNGAVYCHNCSYGSNIVGLIQRVEGVSFSRASQVFKDVNGGVALPEYLTRDVVSNMFRGDLRKDLVKRAIPLPDEYIPLDPNSANLRTRKAIKYLHSRKVTNSQIVAHKMGYCFDGEYKNRVIVPITENGDLRFWVARAISSEAKMKEKSPSDADYQISKSEVIFNIDKAASTYNSIVICEGIWDALSFGDIGVSLLGKSLYTDQLNILLDYRELITDGVYIALDWDAKDNATKIAETLSEYFDVYIINIPKHLDDPNNCLQHMGRKYMWELISSAEEYGEMSSIRRLLT